MRTASELIADARAAMETEDYGEVTAIVCEALGHIRDFSYRTGEVWDWAEIKQCLNCIGDIIYDKGELDGMKHVYYNVHAEMKYVAARYLERAWDGCGDGEWRG